MLMLDIDRLATLAAQVLDLAARVGAGIVTAESCTTGLIALCLSEAPGASQWLHGGYVTYTKAGKTALLGVSNDLLQAKGAVCPEVASAMAQGALIRSPAAIAVAVTGVAGPDRDEDDNPVGRVCIAVARRGGHVLSVEHRYGPLGRDAVRERATADALTALKTSLEETARAAAE